MSDTGIACCSNCKFWSTLENKNPGPAWADERPKGLCRRYAPRPGLSSTWPKTETSDWCGEWESLTD